MPERDRMKENRTISRNLDDRLGATIGERLEAMIEEREAEGGAPAEEGGRAAPGGGDVPPLMSPEDADRSA